MKIFKDSIPYSKTGYFKGLTSYYNDKNEKLKPFYKYTPHIDSFKNAIEDKSKELINRNVLVKVLVDQYANSGLGNDENYNSIILPHINSLAANTTFTVTTGHQLCLFTGPLFFLYKIVSTINLAQKLKLKYPDYVFVPVFWMASEDHDFEEVKSVNLFGKKIDWDSDLQGAVGRMPTESLKILLSELEAIIGKEKDALSLIDLFKSSYLNQVNLADATRRLVHQLFSRKGLVILDGDDPRLKKEFISCFAHDVLNSENKLIVNNTIVNLVNSGLVSNNKIQVHPREINCYYLIDGIRERIERLDNSDNYLVKNTNISFSADELIKHLNEYPERFSPNVVLRPLYQEKILPNLAYIGGPGELSYWFELRDLFESNNINFPVLISRNSVLWIDEVSNAKLKKLNIDPVDLFLPFNQIEKKYIKQFSNLDFQKEEELLNLVFESLIKKTSNIDNTLRASIEGEKKKQFKSIEALENKIIKAEKIKLEVSINQLLKIKERLFPMDGLQERHDNFIPFYLKHGDSFIETLIENLDPFDNSFTIFIEQ